MRWEVDTIVGVIICKLIKSSFIFCVFFDREMGWSFIYTHLKKLRKKAPQKENENI